MGSFLLNNQAYNIKAEGQLATILSYFDRNYVFGVMDDILANRMQHFEPIPKANIVNSFEDNFKSTLAGFPEDKANIDAVREECYRTIIDRLAKAFNFEYRDTDTMDVFSITRLLYDFYVANHDGYIINLLATYIIQEKNMLYKALNMDQFRKDKDVTTINNKKLFDDPQIAIITAHLEYVIQYMMDVDFSMEQILAVTYQNNPYYIASFMQHVFPKGDFYKDYYCSMVRSPNLNPLIVTYLKIEIQRRCMPDNSPINLNF